MSRDGKQSLADLLSESFELHTNEKFLKGDISDPEAAAVKITPDSVTLIQRGGDQGIDVSKGNITLMGDTLSRNTLPQNIYTQNTPWPVKENPLKWMATNVKSMPGVLEGKPPHLVHPTGFMPIRDIPAYLFATPTDLKWLKGVVSKLKEFRDA